MADARVRWRWAGLVAGMIALTTPREAAASDDDGKRHGPRYHGIDLQGVVTTQLLPNTFFGIDAAYVVGNETFQVRAGARVTGARGFELGEGKVANALEVGQLDVCAAKSVFRHRIRMCAGGQAGAMQHRWIGIDPPGRKITPYVAGTLKGDYRYAFTPRFGLLAGVGVSVPVVGPYFRGHDALGRPGPMLFPGPVAGTMTLGVSFSFI